MTHAPDVASRSASPVEADAVDPKERLIREVVRPDD
jgi:hypothetical protein